MDEIKTYIIGVGGSDCDGIDFEIITGTKEDVIDRIWEIMEEFRLEDEEDPDIRCEKNEIGVYDKLHGCDRLYGYVCYYDHHVDIEAKALDEILENQDFYSSDAAKPIWPLSLGLSNYKEE